MINDQLSTRGAIENRMRALKCIIPYDNDIDKEIHIEALGQLERQLEQVKGVTNG